MVPFVGNVRKRQAIGIEGGLARSRNLGEGKMGTNWSISGGEKVLKWIMVMNGQLCE